MSCIKLPASVPRSIEMLLLYEEINIRGTLNMMEAARQQGVKNLLMHQLIGIWRSGTAQKRGRKVNRFLLMLTAC